MIPARVEASKTLALLKKVKELKATGLDIASFTAGEPDFNTPQGIMDRAYKAMQDGETKYVDSQGLISLRKAIAKDYRDRLGVSWATENHILVTAGSKQGIFLALQGLLDLGDQVLVPSPYWVSYPDMVKAVHGVPVIVPTLASDGFFPNVKDLDQYVTPKTKAIILSSPSNPTGTMINQAQLMGLIDWCVARKIVLFYDELYERIVYRGQNHLSASKYVSEVNSEYVIGVNAFSKTLGMTGWRLGYLLSSTQNIKNLTALQSQMLTCVPGFVQLAGEYGLEHCHEFWPGILESFQKRKDLIMAESQKMTHIKVLEPQGAFYLFMDVSKWIQKKPFRDDLHLAEVLLAEHLVSLVPGSSFGMPGWVRLSFATSEEEIKKGMLRLQQFESALFK